MSARDATHYQGEVEVIDAIEAWGLGYRLGNAVKYIARADRKGSRRADLIKARDYIERELTGEWPEPLPEPPSEVARPAATTSPAEPDDRPRCNLVSNCQLELGHLSTCLAF